MQALIDGYIGSFSGSFSAAVLVWPLFSLLCCLPVLVILYRRDGWLPLSTIFAIYASVLYAAGLVCFTLYPLPTGDSGPGITYGIPPILDPLNFIGDIQRDGAYAISQLLLNVVLFVPLGFIAKTLLRLGFPASLALSAAVTLLIETAQLTGLFGVYPFAYRTFEVDDLICNTLGGVVGWGLGQLAVRLVGREDAELPPVTRNPGFARRFVALLTDFVIIDVCSVAPRIVIATGMKVALGDGFAPDNPLLHQLNFAISTVCFVIAFAIVEVVVPWRHDGCTPAGMFYRMSCESTARAGSCRATFYVARAAVLFALMAFLRYTALPLALFYLVARKMPYDLVPATEAEPDPAPEPTELGSEQEPA